MSDVPEPEHQETPPPEAVETTPTSEHPDEMEDEKKPIDNGAVVEEDNGLQVDLQNLVFRGVKFGSK